MTSQRVLNARAARGNCIRVLFGIALLFAPGFVPPA